MELSFCDQSHHWVLKADRKNRHDEEKSVAPSILAHATHVTQRRYSNLCKGYEWNFISLNWRVWYDLITIMCNKYDTIDMCHQQSCKCTRNRLLRFRFFLSLVSSLRLVGVCCMQHDDHKITTILFEPTVDKKMMHPVWTEALRWYFTEMFQIVLLIVMSFGSYI